MMNTTCWSKDMSSSSSKTLWCTLCAAEGRDSSFFPLSWAGGVMLLSCSFCTAFLFFSIFLFLTAGARMRDRSLLADFFSN